MKDPICEIPIHTFNVKTTDGQRGGYCRNTPLRSKICHASRSEAKIHRKSCRIARKAREITKSGDISSKRA